MATTIAVRFPLGRYHATPWDRSVNEGATEWPPSPWRLLRALVATWYTRWPDLPAPVLDGLLDALGDPPSYLTPTGWPGHSRHYLPDLNHLKGETGRTDLTLDPYLSVGRASRLLVRWDADLDPEQRQVLAKLAELVPYLGRADSVCEARLLDEVWSADEQPPGDRLDGDRLPDASWWRPGADGDRTARLLAAERPVRRAVLELSTVDVRKARRTVPADACWVSYAMTEQPVVRPARRQPTTVTAVRFAVVSRAPVTATNGILLADKVHAVAARIFAGEEGRRILGYSGAATDHQHAHWIPVADGTGHGDPVSSLVVYLPDGLSAEEVARLVRIRRVSGQRGPGGDSYQVKGLPTAELLLQGAGPVARVAPELCGPARRWRSLTPYLPVRHRKRESLDEYLSADVGAELAYRDLPPAEVTRSDPADGLPDRWARSYRRYRMSENLGKSRPGLGLRLEFADEAAGPLLLGQLSHFGYGIFVPEPR
jgi:CRISPR-associated protein Csb2